ncbi:hypothetical protein [Membranihabitans maritimus]|uniref:hypothetical protein n=1 Tax=Membranihabitans maritimus TaxID=2904244 RepID=UPI001F3D9028|nr:hypothetical protein [Membranihabitans maritimus]
MLYNITLVSSFHKNLGKCNPDELYKIIEKIQPEIIFEELSPDTFSYVYANGYIPSTIEAIAVKRYLRNYPIKHFPVDNYPINKSDLFNGANEIEKRSIKYSKLWNEQISMIKQYGYDFLNSSACMKLLDKIREEEETVLLEINDIKLSLEYKSENKLNNNREYEMLRNIYNFSKQYPYNRAIFICGAEHREPFMKKIQEYETKEKLILNWTYYGSAL